MNPAPTATTLPWHCHGCHKTFGILRRWFWAHGWLPDRQLPNGKVVHQTARLCEYCNENHNRWRSTN